MKQKIPALITVAALAVGAGGALSVGFNSAQAAPSSARTTQTLRIGVTFIPSSQVVDDAAPAGPSAGDRYVFAAKVTKGGKVIGRLLGSSVSMDSRFRGVQHSLTLLLPGGSIVVNGGATGVPVPGTPVSERQQLAVVGGTGTYAGAHGTYLAKDLNETEQRITVHLVE